jgi:hypothetical protein
MLLPLVLVAAVPIFAGQESGSAQKAALQNEQPETNGASETSHPRHRVRIHLGPVIASAGYSYFSGSAFLPVYYAYGYPYWGYYGYAPLWGGGFWNPAFYGYPPYAYGVGYGDGKGQVKLQVEPKTAEVLIDKAYAGTVAGLKGSMWLSPGVYNLCFKAPGRADFCRRVYVLSGKKLEILAKLVSQNGPERARETP